MVPRCSVRSRNSPAGARHLQAPGWLKMYLCGTRRTKMHAAELYQPNHVRSPEVSTSLEATVRTSGG